jgi:uncharacterized protein YbjT (DUF2867 family)
MNERKPMKIVVIGGTGLIGSKLVALLSSRGHDAIAASPATGVDTISGAGLPEVLAGAQVVVDVSNSPSFDEKAALEFFETSTRNLLAAGQAAGVVHHVALSVVGTERLQASGYFRGKSAQESLILASKMPFSIVHSTQFFEFMGGIARSAAKGQAIHLSAALMQPIASDDVVAALADVALSAPINGMVEIAGPEQFRMAPLVQRYLRAVGDPRPVVADPLALYFSVEIDDRSLVPGAEARLGAIRFETWLAQQQKQA